MEHYDKYCPHCFYAPERRPSNPNKRDEWQRFWHERYIARQCGKRGYCVGGFRSAYQGTDEYEYDFDAGRFIAPHIHF